MNKGQLDDLKISRAMSAVANDFEFFAYVDVKDNMIDGDIVVLSESEMLTKLIPNWDKETSLLERLNFLVDYFVVPNERTKLIERVTMEYFVKRLVTQNLPYFYLYAHCNAMDEEKFYFLKFVGSKDEKGNLNGITFGLKDINEHAKNRDEQEEMKAMKNRAIVALTDDYEAVFIADYKEDDIRTIRMSEFYKTYMPVERKGKNYEEKVAEVIRNSVDPDDQERCLKAFAMDNVLRELEDSASFHITYKLKRQFGRSFTCRAKFARLSDGVSGSFIFGIRFADADVMDSFKEVTKLTVQKDEAKETIDYQIQTLKEKNQQLELFNHQVIDMFASVAELRDADTGDHIEKVKSYTKVLAEEVAKSLPEYRLTLQDVELISAASVLHDVGKIMVPDSVLLKPGKLTPEEFEIIKLHSVNGAKILERAPENWGEEFVTYSKQICLSHHEKWDGRGYPYGLVGDNIPISAQIVSVADCFDALCTERVYKKAFAPEVAFEMILNGDCGVFSPKLMQCFKNVKEKFVGFAAKIATRQETNKIERDRVSISKSLVITNKTLPTIKQLTAEMPVGFVIFRRDGKGTFTYFNKYMTDLMSCETDEGFKAHTNNCIYGLLKKEDIDAIKEKFNAKLLYNETVSFEVEITTFENESRWINVSARKAYNDKSNDFYYAFIENVTSKIKAAEIEETIQKITHSHKVIEKFSNIDEEDVGENAFQGIRVLFINSRDEFDESNESIKELLEKDGAFVAQVQNGYSGVALLARDNHFDAILIDLGNNSNQISSTIRSIRIYEGTTSHKLPIIVIADSSSKTLSQKFLESGANGVLSLPFSGSKFSKALISSMKSRSYEMENRLADTIKKASVDPLTHVKNSSAYTDRVAYIDAKIKEKKAPEFAIVICDINNLKGENDKNGHAVGDIYIRNCSKIICNTFSNSPVYRIGGDEFVVILTDFELRNKDELLDNLFRGVKVAREIDHSRNGKADFAFGIALFDPEIDQDVETVLKRADSNMYEMKAAMKGSTIR